MLKPPTWNGQPAFQALAQLGQASLLGAVDPQHQLLAVEAGHDVVPVILDQADLAGDPAHCAGAAVVELCYGNHGVRP